MPKKSAGSKKGEIDVTQKNDSEDDSLDLDAEGMREAIAIIQQDDQPKKPLVISVSPPLINVADGCIKRVVTFPRTGKTFYAKAGFFKMMISLVCKKRKLLNQNEDNAWIQTISSYKLRKKEFGEESKWFKTASGNTIDVIYFVLSVPIGKEDTFDSMLKSQIQFFFDVTRKQKSNTTGKLLLEQCQSLPQGQKG